MGFSSPRFGYCQVHGRQHGLRVVKVQQPSPQCLLGRSLRSSSRHKKRRTWHKFKRNCHQLVSLEQRNIFRYIDSDHSILKQSPSLEKSRAGLRYQFVHFNKGSMPVRKWRTQETNNYIKLVKWTCRPQGSTNSKVGNNVEGVLGPEATEVKNVLSRDCIWQFKTDMSWIKP